MNREIKFRGKRLDNGEWVYGFLIANYDPHIVENIICEAWIYEGLRNLVNPISVELETIGQFTGIKDKNGKEIYDGDIVRMFSGAIRIIGWSIVGACFTLKNIKPLSEVYESFEIIGNVFENPELLKP